MGKISNELRVYESVDGKSVSYDISIFDGKKDLGH